MNVHRVQWYLKYFGNDGANRNTRFHQKSWKRDVFGNDWFFRLFLAFGCITQEMVQCVDDVSKYRASLCAESECALASSQDLSRLSERSRAKYLGEVFGCSSVPYLARQAARINTHRYWKRRQQQIYDHRHGISQWGPEVDAEDKESWRTLQLEWDEAEGISFEAGFEFNDRRGCRMAVGKKQDFMVEVVDLLLSRHGGKFKKLRR